MMSQSWAQEGTEPTRHSTKAVAKQNCAGLNAGQCQCTVDSFRWRQPMLKHCGGNPWLTSSLPGLCQCCCASLFPATVDYNSCVAAQLVMGTQGCSCHAAGPRFRCAKARAQFAERLQCHTEYLFPVQVGPAATIKARYQNPADGDMRLSLREERWPTLAVAWGHRDSAYMHTTWRHCCEIYNADACRSVASPSLCV